MSLPEIPEEPLQTGWQPLTLIEVPPEMVVSIAMGMEEPDEIASRHGFTGDKWDRLQRYKPFLDAVARQRAELESSGFTFRLKAALKADMLMDKVFLDAMGLDSTLMQRLEVFKTLAKLGNLEPKEERQQAAGTTFSISIDLGDKSVTLGASQPAPLVMDVTPKTPEPAPEPAVIVERGLMAGPNPFAVTKESE